MTTPLQEQFTSLAATTLNGTINDSTNTVVVTSAALFPTTGGFSILINSEIMYVTGVSSNTFTVERSHDGTTATAHTDTDVVSHIVTPSALKRAIRDVQGLIDYGPPLHSIVDNTGATIDDSDFTAINLGSSTLTEEQEGTLRLYLPPAGGTALRLFTRPHSSSNAYIAAFQWFAIPENSNSEAQHFGIGFRENSTGKFTCIMYVCQAHSTVNEGPHRLQVRNWDDTAGTGFSTIRSEEAIGVIAPVIWLRCEDDGADLTFSIGLDGANWIDIHTVGRTTFMAGGPDEVFFYGQNSGNQVATWLGTDAYLKLIHWSTE
jgi:hypothetical protein